MEIDVFTLFPHAFDWFEAQRHVTGAEARERVDSRRGRRHDRSRVGVVHLEARRAALRRVPLERRRGDERRPARPDPGGAADEVVLRRPGCPLNPSRSG